MNGIDWGLHVEDAQKLLPPDLVLRVDSVTGDDNLDSAGETWQRPFATIQAAVNRARRLLGTTTLDDTKNHRAKVIVNNGHYNEHVWFAGYGITVEGIGPNVPGKDYGVSINYDGAVDENAVILMQGSGNVLRNLHIYCAEAIPGFLIDNGDNHLLENIVIEGDGVNMTYGLEANGLKGSRIEKLVMTGFVTAGIHVNGGADKYFIEGWIRDCLIHSAAADVTGILVDDQNELVAWGALIENNHVILTNGTACKGIDVNNTGSIMVCRNMVSVPASSVAIEHAGGDQFLLHNATAVSTVNADPFPTAA